MKLKCTVDLELIVNFGSPDLEKNCQEIFDKVSDIIYKNYKHTEIKRFDTTIKKVQKGRRQKTTANNG